MPPVDPDNLEQAVQEEYNQGNVWRKWFNFLFGISRTEQQRTLYNAARPFAVLGGVSDQEVQLLFQANGPYAKVCIQTSTPFLKGVTLPCVSSKQPIPFFSLQRFHWSQCGYRR